MKGAPLFSLVRVEKGTVKHDVDAPHARWSPVLRAQTPFPTPATQRRSVALVSVNSFLGGFRGNNLGIKKNLDRNRSCRGFSYSFCVHPKVLTSLAIGHLPHTLLTTPSLLEDILFTGTFG